MIDVSVEIDGKIKSAEISESTYHYIRDGILLRNRSMRWFLLQVVKNYGDLTEENILKFMDEK